MTKKQINEIKRQVLALNYDATRKRTKAVNLSRKLFEAVPSVRFTVADFQAFYRSRGIVKKK